MKLYRIYTENKDRAWIERQASKRFAGFTIVDAIGYWQGKKEKSLIIEIIAQDQYEHKANIATLRDLIRRHNKQESVLKTTQEVEVEF